jgi:hypothetical protein
LAALIDGVEYWKNTEGSVSAFIAKQQTKSEKHMLRAKDSKGSKYEVRLKTATSRSSHTPGRTINRELEAEVKLTHTLLKAKH